MSWCRARKLYHGDVEIFDFTGAYPKSNSYITTDQLQDFQTILNNFDCEIGIPTIPYQKKERLVTSEADSRIIDSTSRSIVWKNTLDECFKLVNKHFNLDLACELRFYDPEPENADKEVQDDEQL